VILICYKTKLNLSSLVDSIAEYFLLKTAVNQRQSQKHALKSLNHKPPCNQSDQRVIVNQWISE